MTSPGSFPDMNRPLVFEYSDPLLFLRDLLEFNKKTKRAYSLRQRVAKVGSCSPSFVSQVLNGQRQLSRDNLLKLAPVLEATSSEVKFLDELLLKKISASGVNVPARYKKQESKTPKNHLLTDWFHPYVKDLILLKGFKAQPSILAKMLKKRFPEGKIQKSIDFLLREGFWRRDLNGDVVPEDNYVESTTELPNEKIRQAHRQALKIAEAGIEQYTPAQRKASTVILSVSEDHKAELRSLLESFENQLTAFIEKYPQGQDELIQVVMHMTPVGEKYEK